MAAQKTSGNGGARKGGALGPEALAQTRAALEDAICSFYAEDPEAAAEKARRILRKIATWPQEDRERFFAPERVPGTRGSLIEDCAYVAANDFGSKASKSKGFPSAHAFLGIGRELAALGATPNGTLCRASGCAPCLFAIFHAGKEGHEPMIEFFSGIGADLNRCDEQNSNALSLAKERGMDWAAARLVELGARMPERPEVFELGEKARAGDLWEDWKSKLAPAPAHISFHLIMEPLMAAARLWGLQAGAECYELCVAEQSKGNFRGVFLSRAAAELGLPEAGLDLDALPGWRSPETAFDLGEQLGCIPGAHAKPAPERGRSPEELLAGFTIAAGLDAGSLLAGFEHRIGLILGRSAFGGGKSAPSPALARALIAEKERELLARAAAPGRKAARKVGL